MFPLVTNFLLIPFKIYFCSWCLRLTKIVNSFVSFLQRLIFVIEALLLTDNVCISASVYESSEIKDRANRVVLGRISETLTVNREGTLTNYCYTFFVLFLTQSFATSFHHYYCSLLFILLILSRMYVLLDKKEAKTCSSVLLQAKPVSDFESDMDEQSFWELVYHHVR